MRKCISILCALCISLCCIFSFGFIQVSAEETKDDFEIIGDYFLGLAGSSAVSALGDTASRAYAGVTLGTQIALANPIVAGGIISDLSRFTICEGYYFDSNGDEKIAVCCALNGGSNLYADNNEIPLFLSADFDIAASFYPISGEVHPTTSFYIGSNSCRLYVYSGASEAVHYQLTNRINGSVYKGSISGNDETTWASSPYFSFNLTGTPIARANLSNLSVYKSSNPSVIMSIKHYSGSVSNLPNLDINDPKGSALAYLAETYPEYTEELYNELGLNDDETTDPTAELLPPIEYPDLPFQTMPSYDFELSLPEKALASARFWFKYFGMFVERFQFVELVVTCLLIGFLFWLIL